MFNKNEGVLDRRIRILVGVLLLVLSYFLQGPTQVVVLILGLIAVGTGISGVCLLYKLFGISTKAK
ncbi:MAG: DUF2892 domain-containing protein [Candidatus Roizmanbacteria bacterium]|nr:DUF2892 domain-containing protein [Candidatus Roizmanbacteria bacterium]